MGTENVQRSTRVETRPPSTTDQLTPTDEARTNRTSSSWTSPGGNESEFSTSTESPRSPPTAVRTESDNQNCEAVHLRPQVERNLDVRGSMPAEFIITSAINTPHDDLRRVSEQVASSRARAINKRAVQNILQEMSDLVDQGKLDPEAAGEVANLWNDYIQEEARAAVQDDIRRLSEQAADSEISDADQQIVQNALSRTSDRLARGELDPETASGIAEIWVEHLENASQDAIQAREARTAELRAMSSPQLGLEILKGVGDFVIESAMGIGRPAETMNEMNPLLTAGDIAADTMVRAFQETVREPVAVDPTSPVFDTAMQTVMGFGHLAAHLSALGMVHNLSHQVQATLEDARILWEEGRLDAATLTKAAVRRAQENPSHLAAYELVSGMTNVPAVIEGGGDPREMGKALAATGGLFLGSKVRAVPRSRRRTRRNHDRKIGGERSRPA